MAPKQKVIFTLILLFSALLRFYHLDQLPPSLNWDEISHSYNAYSLLRTGKDQWGNTFPVFNFRAYGDYPTTLNMYLTIPFVHFFGLNPWTTRLPSAICGFLLVPLTFLLCQKFFKNQTLSFLAMFLTAISPWTIFTSRAVFQSTVAQFFLVLGILLILHHRHQNLGFLSAAISLYAYHNTRIITFPLIFVSLLIFKKTLKVNRSGLILFILISLPCLFQIFSPESRARSTWVSIINPGTVNFINYQRSTFTGHPLIGRLLFNKLTYFVPNFIQNYLDFFNPYLLFFKGSANFQFNVPNSGPLLSVFLPFFYLGIFTLLKKIRQPACLFILVWYLVGLFPSAITDGDFPVIRAMSILPLPQIIISLGLISLSRQLIYLVSVFAIVQLGIYWRNYSSVYPRQYSQSWQFGYQQAVNFAKKNYSQYQQIIFTKKYGEPHQFILFYWPWDPLSYQTDPNLNWNYHTSWYWVDAFDKFLFVDDWSVKDLRPSPNTLLITSHQNYPPTNAKLLQTINFLDQSPAFDIVAYE